MSLRGKIVLLFLGLAVVPLLVVAAFGYVQASKLAKEVVGVSLDASVSQTAKDLHDGLTGVDRTLADLVESRGVRELAGDAARAVALDTRDTTVERLGAEQLPSPDHGRPAEQDPAPDGRTDPEVPLHQGTGDRLASDERQQLPAEPRTTRLGEDATPDGSASPDQGAALADGKTSELDQPGGFDTQPTTWRAQRAAWEAEVEATLGPVAYVTVRSPGGAVIAEAGSRPETRERCTTAGGSRLEIVRRAFRAGSSEVEVEAGVWLDDLVTRRASDVGGSVVVFQRNRGTVLLSSSCDDLKAGVPSDLQVAGNGSARGRAQFERQDAPRLASFVALQNRPWTVAAHARNDTFLAPLQRLQASYWIFVLMLALATVLGFSILLDRVVMSLEDLTAAAAKIGEGELNPWLPPPGRDEVGRLSLAFSGMLERIRQMMQRVDHSGRLAVVGQLTSYLAHEIRNPLSSIRMNLQSLQRDVRRGRIPEDSGEAIAISLREVDRLSSSLTSVLQLGRPSSGPRETISVHDVVEEAAELLTGEFRRSRVTLELELDATADRVTAAPGQLKGVFLNVMMNALEAQPDGGRLEITSRLASAPGRGPVVAIHLRDHGRGIPPDLRERIFEPFFTTRNQGSGIGLAVALRTVREHGGDLFLADLPETAEGAEFVVELPLAAVVAEAAPERSVELPAWMGEREGSTNGDEPWVRQRSKVSKRPFRSVDDAHIRALIELSDSDHGNLH